MAKSAYGTSHTRRRGGPDRRGVTPEERKEAQEEEEGKEEGRTERRDGMGSKAASSTRIWMRETHDGIVNMRYGYDEERQRW